ncbi:hypothetical protein FRC14_002669 [Serendipita sp. 396]|nr:hypothetical protein FRC14_002669 [Serendipita sp. 396]KAG8783749.1 hypothetical protein FRC15_004608 [Serendipita sp. 397]KAG8799563.1 hypothetical protein FRC16_004828 [Serendipita sp. 398]KAG8871725.1 hypothetical protein FRC20_010253 [Serendipita sp. 405]
MAHFAFLLLLFSTSSNTVSHTAIADSGHQSKPTGITEATLFDRHIPATPLQLSLSSATVNRPVIEGNINWFDMANGPIHSTNAKGEIGHTTSEGDASTGETSANDKVIVVEVSSLSESTRHHTLGINETETETYWLIGNGESVSMILRLLIDAKSSSLENEGCGMLKYTLLHIDSTVGHSNILQWRDSPLIALASKASDAFLQPNETLERGKDTAVHPSKQELHSPLLHCLNQTITTGLKSEESTIGALGIAGIALFAVLIFTCVLLCYFFRCIKDGTLRIGIGRANRRDYMNYGYGEGSYHLDTMGLPPLNDPSQIPLGMPLSTPSAITQHVSRRDYVSRRSLTPAPPATGSNHAPTSTALDVPQVEIPPVAHVNEP